MTADERKLWRKSHGYVDYSKDEDYFELKNKKSTRKPN